MTSRFSPAWSANFPKPPSKSQGHPAYDLQGNLSPGSLPGTCGLGGASSILPVPPRWSGSLSL